MQCIQWAPGAEMPDEDSQDIPERDTKAETELRDSVVSRSLSKLRLEILIKTPSWIFGPDSVWNWTELRVELAWARTQFGVLAPNGGPTLSLPPQLQVCFFILQSCHEMIYNDVVNQPPLRSEI